MHVMTGSVNSFPDCPLLQEILINKNKFSGSLALSASGGKAVLQSPKVLSKGRKQVEENNKIRQEPGSTVD